MEQFFCRLLYLQALKARHKEVQAAGYVWPKSKQMIQLSDTAALASCTPYDRKIKHWMESS